MDQTTIIGIDCATDDARIGLSAAVAEADRCVVLFAGTCSSDRDVADEIAAWLADTTRAIIALDAPLGWPQLMGTTLAAHRAGQPVAVAAHDLFRRSTDRFVKEQLGK